MKKKYYINNPGLVLEYHETAMIDKLSSLCLEYANRFQAYDCDLKYRTYWYDNHEKQLHTVFLPTYENGYSCYFNCDIWHGENEFLFEGDKGNGYDTLFGEVRISSISGLGSRHEIKLYDNCVVEMRAQLDELLETIEGVFKNDINHN